MLEGIKVRQAEAVLKLANMPVWMTSVRREDGRPTLVVHIHGYPSMYSIRSGEWYRIDVPNSHQTSRVICPTLERIAVKASEPPQLVALLIVREFIDSLRAKAYPLNAVDVASRGEGWDAELQRRAAELIERLLRWMTSMSADFSLGELKNNARAIVIEQQGLISHSLDGR